MTADGCLTFDFPPELRREVRRLSRLRCWRSGLAIAGDWLIVAGSFALALHVPHPALWLLAALVIASRQHALGILMHDAAHYRLLRRRAWNDRLANWLLAYPVLITVAGYRRHHLAHHAQLNTPCDPDWARKRGDDWTFPKTRPQLARLLIRDLLGGGVVEMLRAMQHLRRAAAQQPSPWLDRLCYYLLVVAAIGAAGWWLEVLLLWFVPLFTFMPVLMRLRSIAEHSGLPGEHTLNMTRTVRCPPWERWLFLPHNVHYHLDHHLFPSVPFYQLPALHALLASAPEYAAQAHVNDSLLGLTGSSVLNDLTVPSVAQGVQ